MATTNGSDWFVLVGGITSADKILCQTSASLDITQDTIEVTCKDSIWKKYISGEKSWTISVEANRDDAEGSVQSEIFDNILGLGGEMDVAIVYAPNGGAIVRGFSGKAIVTADNSSFPQNDKATKSFTLQGSGVLTKMTVV